MSNFFGRAREAVLLRDVLVSAGPSLSVVRGLPGMGTTALVARVLADLPSRSTDVFAFTVPRLPSPDLRALLAARAQELPGTGSIPPDAGWSETFNALARITAGGRGPKVVVLDDTHHLVEARSGIAGDLVDLWTNLRAHALPVHLVLAGRDPAMKTLVAEAPPEIRGAVGLDLSLSPLSVREVASAVPRYDPRDRVRTWAIFGGSPNRVRYIDPAVTLATNVRRLILAPGAPFLRAGEDLLSREVQSPARYASLVRALALGARDWGELRSACPDVASGSQMAPYLARLEEMEWVEARRSLDAGPRSRGRRYELTDPFIGFWFRYVLPRLADLTLKLPHSRHGSGAPVLWSGVTAGGPEALDDHVALHLPRALRDWTARHAGERLGTTSRETGGLWGPGYDLPLAGTLRNGAVFYGHVLWPGRPIGDEAVDAVAEELRSTRYGFGKERRLRVVFSGGGVAPKGARRAARDDRVVLLETKDLTGG